MVGNKHKNHSPYVHESGSKQEGRMSHTRIEQYTSSQSKSKFIRDIEERENLNKNSARQENHLLMSHNSKEQLQDGLDSNKDPLRRSHYKNTNKPSINMEKGIINKKRLESGRKGK